MPRAFTPDESDRIRARLKEASRQSFSRNGLRGTSVEELARAAAISKGTFYRFFDSKESLLLTLLDEYELATHAEIEAAVRTDPWHGVDVLVDHALHVLEHDPLLPVLMSEEGLRAVHSRGPDQEAMLMERDERLADRVLSVLREAGITVDVTEQQFLGLLRSLVFVGLHRADIGSDLVDAVGQWTKQHLRSQLLAPSEGAAS